MNVLNNSLYCHDIEWITETELPWDKLRNNKVLITGATGMIASCFVDALMTLNKNIGLSCRVIAMGRNEGIRHVLSSIGESLDVMTAEAIINDLYLSEVLNSEQAKLILAACSNNALSPASDGFLKNRLRASIFKNLLLMFI